MYASLVLGVQRVSGAGPPGTGKECAAVYRDVRSVVLGYDGVAPRRFVVVKVAPPRRVRRAIRVVCPEAEATAAPHGDAVAKFRAARAPDHDAIARTAMVRARIASHDFPARGDQRAGHGEAHRRAAPGGGEDLVVRSRDGVGR